MTPDSNALQAEIQQDPMNLGYSSWLTAADDTRIHGLINDPSKRSLPNVLVPSWLIVNCLDPTDFSGLTVLQNTALSALLSPGRVDLASASVRSILAGLFPVLGTTRTALLALWTAQPKTLSRAQELNWQVSGDDMLAARAQAQKVG